LAVLFVLASSGIYLIENKVQPEAFGSIPAAMWWAMATLTTVGYGDVVPVTILGKVFGGAITIIGVGMVALPAGIIASGFSEHLREQRTSYDELFGTLLDEQAPPHTRKLAAATLGNTLNLREQTVQRLLQTVSAKKPAKVGESSSDVQQDS
jgi:voltage-gated potassium channel